jgi:hypothetical protein
LRAVDVAIPPNAQKAEESTTHPPYADRRMVPSPNCVAVTCCEDDRYEIILWKTS